MIIHKIIQTIILAVYHLEGVEVRVSGMHSPQHISILMQEVVEVGVVRLCEEVDPCL